MESSHNCVLCQKPLDESLVSQRDQDSPVHSDCIRWACSVSRKADGSLAGVEETLLASKDVQCVFCREKGAVFQCNYVKCPKVYHLTCAERDRAIFVYEHEVIYCQGHKRFVPKTKSKFTSKFSRSKSSSGRVFHVESILKHRMTKNNVQLYLVKWKDYPVSEATWEPESSFIDKTVLDQYLAGDKLISCESVETEKSKPMKSRKRSRSPVCIASSKKDRVSVESKQRVESTARENFCSISIDEDGQVATANANSTSNSIQLSEIDVDRASTETQETIPIAKDETKVALIPEQVPTTEQVHVCFRIKLETQTFIPHDKAQLWAYSQSLPSFVPKPLNIFRPRRIVSCVILTFLARFARYHR